MAKDHGQSVKDGKLYEGLREKGMSKNRAQNQRGGLQGRPGLELRRCRAWTYPDRPCS